MTQQRSKPSSKARTTGYGKLHAIRRVLTKLFYPNLAYYDENHFTEYFESNDSGWKQYMIKHIPEDKRGGPSRH